MNYKIDLCKVSKENMNSLIPIVKCGIINKIFAISKIQNSNRV